MSTGSRVAGAVAAGYALGRFKKLRLAVLVATAMSSPKFRDAAFGLIENRIPGGAIVGTLSKEVGSKLLDAGKAAATSVVASRIDSLSENLAGRSNNMRGGAPNGQSRSRADEAADDRGSTEPEDEASEEEEEPEAEYDEEETDEAEEPEAEYDEEETDEAEEPEAEYDEEDEEETDEPEAEYDEEDEEETDEAEEPEAEDAARVRDDGDSADEEDEEPVARSPRRRRSASPAGRRRG
jgi:outer membrane biosynthesis protein TonB